MSKQTEALAEQPAQQESWEDLHNALQRIDTAAVGLPNFEIRHEGGLDAVTQNIVDAIVALHEQPVQQEPVAWITKTGNVWKTKAYSTDIPLYTSPPTLSLAQRQARSADTWVGLSVVEVVELVKSHRDAPVALVDYVEAKLKEKNT